MEATDVREYISASPLETEQLGTALAAELNPGMVVAFFGDMGSGKTVFTRGLAKGLQWTWDELDSTGFYDYIDQGCVLAVEWSENIENALPEDAVRVEFFRGSTDTERIIQVTGATIHEDLGS